MSRFKTKDNHSGSESQVLRTSELLAELRVSRNWLMARLDILQPGVDWFTVEAGNRIGKGGIRCGGCEYRFRVSALDKLRQAGQPDTQLDPMQGASISEITAIIKRRAAINLER